MKTKILFAFIITGFSSFAQNTTSNYFNLTRKGFNEKNAYETTAFVEKYFRVPGNTGFNASINQVESILKKSRICSTKAKRKRVAPNLPNRKKGYEKQNMGTS